VKLSELVRELQEILTENGDMEVVVCADGSTYHAVELEIDDEILYVEVYKFF